MEKIIPIPETLIYKRWNKVDGVPIRIYDYDTDGTIVFGPGDQDMGDTYYILETCAYAAYSPSGMWMDYLWTKRKFVNENQMEMEGRFANYTGIMEDVLHYDGHVYFKNYQFGCKIKTFGFILMISDPLESVSLVHFGFYWTEPSVNL